MKLIDTLVDTPWPLRPQERQGLLRLSAEAGEEEAVAGLKDLYPQKRPEEVDYEELKQRFLVTIALEAARVMEEGIVTDPREADVGSILAFGFAPFTGGALSYIDGIGAKEFVAIAKTLQKKYGAEFKAPKLLLDMAAKGETFYQRFDPYAKGGRAGRLTRERPRVRARRTLTADVSSGSALCARRRDDGRAAASTSRAASTPVASAACRATSISTCT